MSTVTKKFLAHKRMPTLVDELLEKWFEENRVPSGYRMSIPLVLLFQETNNVDCGSLDFFVGVLPDQKEGNC